MGFATHLGPWLLGTVKNTTGTTAGTIQNTGTALVSQTKKVVYTGTVAAATATTTLFTIPAGAQIGSTAANVVIGTSATTNLFWASSDITSQGRLANTNSAAKLVNWAGAASTASPNGIGVGSTDVIIQAALTPTVADVTAGTVQYTIVYAVADSTGAQSPSGTQQ
jgi:predicted membrane protein